MKKFTAMNLLNHIYAIQNLLNAGRIPEERRFSNNLVKDLFEMSRSAIYKNQLNKNYGLMEFNYQPICVPMEQTTYSDCLTCNGLQLECPIWKSTFRIPSIINYKEGLAIKVTDLEGNVISRLTLINSKYNQYSVTKQEMFGWFISSGYLYVISNNPIQKLIVQAIFEHPSAIMELQDCGVDDTQICTPLSIDNYPLDASLTDMVYELTLNKLRGSLYPKDNLNDANNNISVPASRNQN